MVINGKVNLKGDDHQQTHAGSDTSISPAWPEDDTWKYRITKPCIATPRTKDAMTQQAKLAPPIPKMDPYILLAAFSCFFLVSGIPLLLHTSGNIQQVGSSGSDTFLETGSTSFLPVNSSLSSRRVTATTARQPKMMPKRFRWTSMACLWKDLQWFDFCEVV